VDLVLALRGLLDVPYSPSCLLFPAVSTLKVEGSLEESAELVTLLGLCHSSQMQADDLRPEATDSMCEVGPFSGPAILPGSAQVGRAPSWFRGGGRYELEEYDIEGGNWTQLSLAGNAGCDAHAKAEHCPRALPWYDVAFVMESDI
jgi:hypothetical protein